MDLTNQSSPSRLPTSPAPPASEPASVPLARDGFFLWVVLGLLWTQFCWSCAHAWRYGDYYEYGWFVPPLAAWFFYRRLAWAPKHAAWVCPMPALVLQIALALVLLVTRTLWYLDPAWRLPLWGHALTLALATHILLAQYAGWRYSRHFIPVTLFALTCAPYPSVLEAALVTHLTQVVVILSQELFNLAGMPVLARGVMLELGGRVAEVAEGCSGMRSFQSFLMAAVFFGELYTLRLGARLLLIAAGLAFAIAVNTGRAMTLANIVFDSGAPAAEAVHGKVGTAAFLITATLFFVLAEFLRARHDSRGRRRVVRSVTLHKT